MDHSAQGAPGGDPLDQPLNLSPLRYIARRDLDLAAEPLKSARSSSAPSASSPLRLTSSKRFTPCTPAM